MQKLRDLLVSTLVLAVLLALAFVLGRVTAKNGPGEPPTPSVDTLYLHDTITLSKPVKIAVLRIDSVLVPVGDTVHVHDTAFVWLEREQIAWTDTLCTVFASGIQPSVDSVRHYVTTQVITKTVPVKVQPRWAVGVTAGYGASKDGLSPFLGVGVSYVLKSW